MKKYLKSKSTSHLSQHEIENGCHTIRFMSFESAIQMFRQQYGLMELKNDPLGYRITEQGIEIIFQ